MTSHKHVFTALILTILTLMIYETTHAKSVYVISNIDNKKTRAYKVEGNSLSYQTDYTTAYASPVGIAIDESEHGQFLFLTFEFSNMIEIINAKTMEPIDTMTVPNVEDGGLAGITADNTNSKIYIMDRYTDHLYCYSWDPLTKTLSPDFNEPYYVELEDVSSEPYEGAFGIALDEENALLYVVDNTDSIKYYNTDDWSKIGEVNNVSCNVISIAIDVNNQLLYYGSMGSYGQGNPNLYQYDISAQTEDSVNVGSSVAGIAVDQQTSLVYITTYGDGSNPDRLIIYNSNLVKQTWDSGDIGNPTGIAVGNTAQYKQSLLKICKTDNAGPDNRPLPGQYIDYTIFYDANGHSVTDLNITDHLPDEVSNLPNDVNFSEPNGTYDPNTHTVTWSIGPLSPTDSNSLTLNVRIDPNAPYPLETIVNFVEAESDSSYNSVYCLTPDVIYVDADANAGSDTGLSWQNAFLDLQDALERAKRGIGSRIWVADGNYHPTDNPTKYDAAFNLENNLALYGGFAANETHLSQRNYLINETVLSGDLDDDNDTDAYYVVKAVDVTQTARIDGFTIKGGSSEGIYLSNSSLTVANSKITENYRGIHSENLSSTEILNSSIYSNDDCGIYCNGANETNILNCTIKQNGQCGIYSWKSPLNISDCLIKDNGADGIYADHDNDTTLADSTIQNSVISGNNDHGIYWHTGSKIEIKNNWVYRNGAGNSGDGIYIPYAYPVPVTIRNNTIANNNDYGINSYYGEDDVNIVNCIIWNNSDDLYNCSATYSCVKDNDSGQGNIHSDPCLVDPNNDNYHISPNSPCIDAGNTALITDQNETDIDTEPRVWDGDGNDTSQVDIGADEYYWSPADFNKDEIVNFIDYAMFADSWCMNPTENPNDYNDLYDLKDNNSIDSNDLDRFCHEWLWEPAWTKNAEEMMMMRAGSTTYMTTLPESTSVTTLYTPTPDQLLKFQPPPLDMDETIKWLEYLWLTDPLLRENIDEKQWLEFIEDLEFIEAVEDSFKDFLY